MRALVTGATGFVGVAIVPSLARAGYEVLGVGRTAPKYLGITALGQQINAGPLLDPNADWSPLVAGVDIVVHLAGRVHVMRDRASNRTDEFRRSNSLGTERLACQAAEAGVRRFVYVSSIKVNGERTFDRPFRETDEVQPEDPYAVSKWEAEQALLRLSRKTGLEVVIVRPPLIYGPGVKGNFLRLLRLVRAGIPIPLAKIDNRRSFVGIDNLVDLILACVEHPQAAGEVFLAADGEDLSTPDLIGRLARAMGKKNGLFPFPVALLRSGARLLRQTSACERLCDSLTVDASKASALIGWSPRLSVDEGIERMVAWYMESIRQGASNTRGAARQSQ